jgi:long-chain acyl-CoA synthetase
LPASLAVRFFERFGVPILNAYGQTETAGEVIGWMAEDVRLFGDAKLGSVGRPHPGVDVRFLDEAGNDSGEGELCIRSKTLLNRFLNGDSPELVDGFLRTGDLGRMDADGFIWLTGRRSDVVNRGGFKVLPEEVEEVIRSHPSVADVMVAGLPDDRLGEVPVAFVVVRGQVADDLAESIQAHVGDQAARYKIPTAVHFVSQLPRNDMGKLLRRRAPELLNTTKEKA